ncbi:MAG: Bax inhibitor-1 family protein [Verrucomicrobiota bacterium]|nr:Bax inhibitor-1 family protein [Verrucomicrobiota bacterium]MDG1892025.1 Bax inhibitor-1 family protein [Verrucomicrobiota bacterium]
MNTFENTLPISQGLFGSMELDDVRSSAIKKTYMLLSMSVLSALVGGSIGSSSPGLVQFFGSGLGWIVAMVALNGIPYVAMACRHNPVMGTMALIGDGFVSGLVLAPVLYMASVFAPDIVPAALILTAVVFAGVSVSVMITKVQYSAPRGLMMGMFFAIAGITLLNMFLNIGFLGVLIASALGIFGVFILVNATSQVLNSPEYDEPVGGALMLFAGLFNVFVAILHLLLAFSGRDD